MFLNTRRKNITLTTEKFKKKITNRILHHILELFNLWKYFFLPEFLDNLPENS